MYVLLIIISILLIALVILQSNKSAAASSSVMGGNDELFSNRKERGRELFITRLTAVLGAVFMIICVVMEYIK